MSNELERRTDPGQPMVCPISLKGHLGAPQTYLEA
jgi:hypothetical protein